MEQFYAQRKSKLDPINIMLASKRASNSTRPSIRPCKIEKKKQEPIKLVKMNQNEKIEGEELFDFNK